MAASDLDKVGRLINHSGFESRVGAAMLLHAQAVLGTAAGNQKNLVLKTLLQPMFKEISMIALVASDTGVLSQVTVTDTYADITALADAEIRRVVSAKWATVATKYPTDPTPAA